MDPNNPIINPNNPIIKPNKHIINHINHMVSPQALRPLGSTSPLILFGVHCTVLRN